MVLQPRHLLCGDAEKRLAVQPVAWQHGEPTWSSSSDGDVLFALPSTQSRIENRSRAGFKHRVAVEFDDEEPVEQQVHVALGDGSGTEQRTSGRPRNVT